ncbi:response regulator transcription factor [Cohnella lubricantis]|uniref:Response regulator transcription factor n=1 Tax=Cohnella lubricantis TaxID=2163172 RepID=A0A841TBH5_9BACL|nr:response regulator transcription factor [Cohnella lubricantis]MBB6678362.1 response regulator transcription factor [Cohnella lubricantis]MBP2116742.1 DNA-binding NarL/FixJ family response regulator [Cohnella lubricantis]
MKQPLRVMLVDDHKHARQGMREIVSEDEDFAVVAEASSGEEALALMESASPELVLMDISMPGMGGLEAAKTIKAGYPDVKIVIVTVSDEPAHLFEALKKGAQGYLLKNLNPSAWREYLRAIAYDEAPLNPDLALSILKEFAARPRSAAPEQASGEQTGVRKEDGGFREELTPREKEILLEVARGRTNRDIAQELGLSEHTVKNHLKNILHKLHLANRVQLTRYAYERGLVGPTD